MASQIDYQDFIDELMDEVGTGSLQMDETIQILRDETPEADGYKAIVDWYYSKEAMDIELTPSEEDDEDDLEEAALLKEQYEKDVPNLEEMTVEACLKEMKDRHIPPQKGKKNKGSNPFF